MVSQWMDGAEHSFSIAWSRYLENSVLFLVFEKVSCLGSSCVFRTLGTTCTELTLKIPEIPFAALIPPWMRISIVPAFTFLLYISYNSTKKVRGKTEKLINFSISLETFYLLLWPEVVY